MGNVTSTATSIRYQALDFKSERTFELIRVVSLQNNLFEGIEFFIEKILRY